MAEKTKGIYRLVTVPAVYERIQLALSGGDPYARVGALLFEGLENKAVLEIGCGPGRWSTALGHTAKYTGIDWNPRHIEQARARFGSVKADFICGDLAEPSLFDQNAPLDAVIGIGILHHLDDPTAQSVLARAAQLLVPGGVFIGLEPVRHKGQHPIARLLKSLDSGRNIREEDDYKLLFPKEYTKLEVSLRTDLMRVPYSHLFIRATTAPL